MSVYHVEVVLRVRPSLQIPYEDVPVVASRQDDPGVEGVRLQHKHLGLVALETKQKNEFSFVFFKQEVLWRLNQEKHNGVYDLL